MDKIKQIIKETFERKIFDNDSKKSLKQLANASNLEQSDLNLLLKNAFEMFRSTQNDKSFLFLTDWLEEITNTIIDLGNNNKNNNDLTQTVRDIRFSPIDNCRNGIIDFLDTAKNSIKICVFTISDNVISDQIIKYHNNGIDIKIITDNEKVFDKGSDIERFVEAGIKVKVDESSNHMHHKFAITDQDYLLTGSYNWTRSAAMYNQENYMITSDVFAIKEYEKEFKRLWQTSKAL